MQMSTYHLTDQRLQVDSTPIARNTLNEAIDELAKMLKILELRACKQRIHHVSCLPQGTLFLDQKIVARPRKRGPLHMSDPILRVCGKSLVVERIHCVDDMVVDCKYLIFSTTHTSRIAPWLSG